MNNNSEYKLKKIRKLKFQQKQSIAVDYTIQKLISIVGSDASQAPTNQGMLLDINDILICFNHNVTTLEDLLEQAADISCANEKIIAHNKLIIEAINSTMIKLNVPSMDPEKPVFVSNIEDYIGDDGLFTTVLKIEECIAKHEEYVDAIETINKAEENVVKVINKFATHADYISALQDIEKAKENAMSVFASIV